MAEEQRPPDQPSTPPPAGPTTPPPSGATPPPGGATPPPEGTTSPGGSVPLEYGTPPGSGYTGPEPDDNARTMGMLCHLLALAGLVIPFGNIIGPLIVWLMKKDAHPFIDDQGKESLNFQITATIALIIASLTIFICIGVVLAPAVGIAVIVLVIIATIRAKNGEAYRYPLTLRLIK